MLITLLHDNNDIAFGPQRQSPWRRGVERGKRELEGEKERNDKVSWERRNTEVKDNTLGFVGGC